MYAKVDKLSRLNCNDIRANVVSRLQCRRREKRKKKKKSNVGEIRREYRRASSYPGLAIASAASLTPPREKVIAGQFEPGFPGRRYRAFAEKIYEPSPQSRPAIFAAAGEDRDTHGKHTRTRRARPRALTEALRLVHFCMRTERRTA